MLRKLGVFLPNFGSAAARTRIVAILRPQLEYAMAPLPRLARQSERLKRMHHQAAMILLGVSAKG
jgi:hypothetical protein